MRKANMNNKVLLTGGHAGSTAVAVIEELEKYSNLDLFWIGSSKAVEGKKSKTLESKLIPDKNIKYFEISAGRLQKRFTRHTLVSLVKVPIGFFQAFSLINKIRPDVVLSFGGFVSVPVVLVAWLFRIPIIVHEQTIAIGLANKMASLFATKIALSRKDSIRYYGSQKIVLTGNPINKKILSINRHPVKNFIFIMGGSRGSQIINEVVFKALPELTKKYKVVHQTGELDFETAKRYIDSNYTPFDFLTPSQVANNYSKASLVISRAGANSVSELGYLKIPTIFIPIPWTRYDEQTKNAQMGVEVGFARIIPQQELSPENLIALVNETINGTIKLNNSEYKKIKIDAVASENIAKLVYSFLK